jgi:hypothetical protein
VAKRQLVSKQAQAGSECSQEMLTNGGDRSLQNIYWPMGTVRTNQKQYVTEYVDQQNTPRTNHSQKPLGNGSAKHHLERGISTRAIQPRAHPGERSIFRKSHGRRLNIQLADKLPDQIDHVRGFVIEEPTR